MLIQRWLLWCMVITVWLLCTEGFRVKNGKNLETNQHKHREQRATLNKPKQGRQDTQIVNRNNAVIDVYNGARGKPSNDPSTNVPLVKKQEIVEEYDEHNIEKTPFSKPFMMKYKKANIMDVDDFKHVSDVDRVVGETVDSIFGENSPRFPGDEKDSYGVHFSLPMETHGYLGKIGEKSLGAHGEKKNLYGVSSPLSIGTQGYFGQTSLGANNDAQSEVVNTQYGQTEDLANSYQKQNDMESSDFDGRLKILEDNIEEVKEAIKQVQHKTRLHFNKQVTQRLINDQGEQLLPNNGLKQTKQGLHLNDQELYNPGLHSFNEQVQDKPETHFSDENERPDSQRIDEKEYDTNYVKQGDKSVAKLLENDIADVKEAINAEKQKLKGNLTLSKVNQNTVEPMETHNNLETQRLSDEEITSVLDDHVRMHDTLNNEPVEVSSGDDTKLSNHHVGSGNNEVGEKQKMFQFFQDEESIKDINKSGHPQKQQEESEQNEGSMKEGEHQKEKMKEEQENAPQKIPDEEDEYFGLGTPSTSSPLEETQVELKQKNDDQSWSVKLDTDNSNNSSDNVDDIKNNINFTNPLLEKDNRNDDIHVSGGKNSHQSYSLKKLETKESGKDDSYNKTLSHDENVHHNTTTAAKFINEHPVAFKILMEYFQNETKLHEKNKLNDSSGTENALKKSHGLLHSKKQRVKFRHFLDKLIKLTELKTEAEIEEDLKARNLWKKRRRKQKLKEVSATRKADMTDTSNFTSHIMQRNSTSFPGQRLHQYNVRPLVSQTDVKSALRAIESTINNLVVQNARAMAASPTQQVSQPVVQSVPQQLPNLDAKTFLYKKRLKVLQLSLSQNYFKFWMYHFRSFAEMSITPQQLRSGIASLGSTSKLVYVMKKALLGKTINILVVGGSISAGGGLERDRHDVHGIYFKAFEEWWGKVVTPITGSMLQMDVVAIGGTDSEYFSYCIKNYINHPPDLVLWELAANDYRRYTGRNMDPAKPLEQLTRVLLTLSSHPAIIFVNFFRGDYYRTTLGQNCPDSEDEGGRLIAEYYKITSLSWRNVICSQMQQENSVDVLAVKRQLTPLTLKTLFSSDGYHPSLLGHAQCASLLIFYIRGVFDNVVLHELYNIDTGKGITELPSISGHIALPRPIYDDPGNPQPFCWTLLTADYQSHVSDTLPGMRILQASGFILTNITHWPVRTDRLRCLKAEYAGAFLTMSFISPSTVSDRTKPIREIALITHNSFSGSATVWLDDNFKKPMFILEPTGQRRTQLNIISRDLITGGHIINVRAEQPGFCVSALAIL